MHVYIYIYCEYSLITRMPIFLHSRETTIYSNDGNDLRFTALICNSKGTEAWKSLSQLFWQYSCPVLT